MNRGWIYRDQVAEVGLTLLDYYSQRYQHSSRAEWRERIVHGQILLEGGAAEPEQILQPGQQLAYHRPPWIEPDVPLEFETLYADADLLVIAKPSGLPVLPGGGFLEHTLLGQLARIYPTETPLPIHRLGRGTSGLLLLARSAQARSGLSQQMRQRQIHKVYRALVGAGLPDELPDTFTVQQPIGKIPYPGLGQLYAATPDGQFAQSDCRVWQRRTNATLIEVTILTGRPHQIRIHLASVGYPLLGDPLYGAGGLPRLPTDAQQLAVPGDCGYWLHAHRLEFQHPCRAEIMQFICPPPAVLDDTTPDFSSCTTSSS
ncbi:MAG: RluA family pseudouridine synthase [Pegethrix bostrychoides GSE-TBD4-15B]|uniref:Pseudouridine synthase n=1 Tax=Pegethrix bostrychoides GSE-TBD4-15B TaxID=2839662 RepID=A0A951U6V7_9CYAN|nr:RluA family pseudouridine synthase [Pegethrix bostrychoides GSE-TBD4-15B]